METTRRDILKAAGAVYESYSTAEEIDHQHREVAAATARAVKSLRRALDPLLVPGDVPKGPLDGPGHGDEERAGVGRTVIAEKRLRPAIDSRVRPNRRHERCECGPILQRVGERKGSSFGLYGGTVQVGRDVVEAHHAREASGLSDGNRERL